MTQEALHILVVDDQNRNLLSIDKLVKAGHNVDTASCFIEAAKKMLRAQGSNYKNPLRKVEGMNKAKGGYDAILTDLNFPLGGDGYELVNMKNDQIAREREAPLGYSLVFLAAQKGIQYAAIITSTNHHQGPIAASFDLLYGVPPMPKEVGPNQMIPFEPTRVPYKMNNTKVMMFDNRDLPSLPKAEYMGIQPKNWLAALNKLCQKNQDANL